MAAIFGAGVQGRTQLEAVAAVREAIEETAIPVGLTPVPSAELARALQLALVDDAPFDALLDERARDREALLAFYEANAPAKVRRRGARREAGRGGALAQTQSPFAR
mgnify:CR=1 FL=1